MEISKTMKVAPGRYVVAVSGGVDSVVLLDILQHLPNLKLTVAHYDHGIRKDSKDDRLFVENLSLSYGLPFVYDQGSLGSDSSEDKARIERYKFLHKVVAGTGSRAIITAHHMDDVIETATHNILRGTGRRGMSSLKSIDGIIRPLSHLPKQHLINYATANGLQWREDSTNKDVRYRRNYIRHVLLPKAKARSPENYERLKHIIKRQVDLNEAIDTGLRTLLHLQPSTTSLNRYDIIGLPHSVALDMVGQWLRQNGKSELNRKLLERVTVAIKTGKPNTTLQLDKNHNVIIGIKTVRIVNL